MAPDEPDPLHRLSRAVEVYLERVIAGESEPEEEFLAAHEDLRDLLVLMLANCDAAQELADAASEQRLGDYRILREIGRGGMGVVYEAEQISLQRRVALKVLPRHLASSPTRIERFRREASAAARLRHRGIVPIYDVGAAAGTHYYAMESVDGLSLRKALDDVFSGSRDALGVLPNASWPAEIAELAAQVAEALAYAHAHGVVHRDVKPHNILIDHDGCARIVDFGLAKDLESDSLSGTGDFAGTPFYMSPEQTRGERGMLDGRTDVFSLGVVLYEALAHRRPFDGDSTDQVVAAINSSEPLRLRRHDPRVPRDLEIICHHALEKRMADRYADASAMAADLRHFLRHEPISARPSRAAVRLWKLVRRRPAHATATGLGIGLLIVASAFLAYRSQRENEHADALGLVRRAVQEAQEALVTGGVSHQPQKERFCLAQIESAFAAYEKLLSESGEDPILALEAGVVRVRAGQLYRSLGRLPDALECHDRAVELTRRAPSVNRAYYLAAALQSRALVRRDARAPGADEDLREAIELCGPLVEEDGPLQNKSRAVVAYCQTSHAVHLMSVSDRAAMTAAEQALHEALSLWDLMPDDELGGETNTLIQLARLYAATARMDLAIKTARRAIECGERCLAAKPGFRERRHDELLARDTLAEFLRLAGRLDEAEIAFRACIEQATALSRDFELSPAYANQVARARYGLGKCLMRMGRTADGMEQLRQAKAVVEPLIHNYPDDPTYRAVFCFVGRALLAGMQAGDPAEYVVASRPILDAYRELVASQPTLVRHSTLGGLLNNLAKCEQSCGDHYAALDHAREAVEHQTTALAGDPDNARYRTFLGKHYALLLQELKRSGDHVGLADAAESYIDSFSDEKNVVSAGLKHLCLCVQMARSDPSLDDEGRRRLAATYGKRAVARLEIMVERGMTRRASIARSSTFKALRELESFQEFVADRDPEAHR